jgi:hypothetical protein
MRQCIMIRNLPAGRSPAVDNVTINGDTARGTSMDASQAVAHIHWLAVAVTAIVGFPLGALWYGPLFGNAWMAATGISADRVQQSNKGKIYGTTLLLNVVIATSLAMFIGSTASLQDRVFAGFMAGLSYVAAALGITYLFEFRSLKLWGINAGYQVVMFSAMGAITRRLALARLRSLAGA